MDVESGRDPSGRSRDGQAPRLPPLGALLFVVVLVAVVLGVVNGLQEWDRRGPLGLVISLVGYGLGALLVGGGLWLAFRLGRRRGGA